MLKAHKYKLYRSRKNRKLHRLCTTAGRIYNHCVALNRRYYRLCGKSLGFSKLQSHIAKLRKTDPYWKELNSQTVQDISQRLEKGWKAFFKKSAKRPPTFKKSRTYRSFTFKQSGFKLDGNKIHINSLKTSFGFHYSRPYGNPKTVTVSRDNCGDFWLTIVFDEEIQTDKIKSGKTAGFDFGMKTFLTSSNGTEIESPLFYKRSQSKLAKAQRILSRKEKGSKNRRRAKLNVARVHRKTVNRRNDYQWNLAHRLISNYDVLCFENLHMKAMQMMWGRKISDLAFSDFMRKLEWLAKKHGKHVQKIDRFFPSSKTCSDCGHIVKKLPLNVREWECPECGTHHQRDFNAAKNIHREGILCCVRDSKTSLLKQIPQPFQLNGETAESILL